MSADSPARSANRLPYVSGVSSGNSSPACVPPQPVTDKSFIDSVTGFINEVVPTSYSATIDPKEQVQWARFEYTDINDLTVYGLTESDSPVPPPLLLVLGYTNGVQVWSIPANGEATEVLSWRQGNVRVLRILPTPLLDSFNTLEDLYSHKRPLVALCDTIAPGPHFCSLGFISLKDGDQVKSIQFKNPIIDVLANRSSIIVTFTERIAIFDAHTLEDRMTVTTCYPCPGLCPNPVALGSRWLAYAERTMIPAWRSSGGCEGEGVPSYTATVIHAAKSLGKGLRELGESVASSLTGTSTPHHNSSGTLSDNTQPGIVTILDIQTPIEQEVKTNYVSSKTFPVESVLAHFAAHSEPIVNLAFDPTGLLLLTADKRGHDFHLFKIHPHPCGSSLAAVHHLYVLHRGDTTSKVQDVSFSWDSRWAAISTLRGTTHVFPITPYGGPVGVRTHATPHVVNRLSRFHRSAGLSADGRSNSPVSTNEIPSAVPYVNPRLPPFPHPTIVYPLAQIRQPSQFGPGNISLQTNVRSSSNRQRLASTSEDSPNLKLCSAFASPRAWLLEPREPRHRSQRHTTESLFIMACHGSLIQYDLDPRHATNIPREKVCDETSIELQVEAKARWTLIRQHHFNEIQAPLALDNPLLGNKTKAMNKQKSEDDERWLSQVEIVTHAGPHRRLWMGPQFMFKTYNTTNAVPLSMTDIEAVEISVGSGSRPARSNPVNMPHGGNMGARPLVPVLIESTSASSYEQSPRLLEMHRNYRRDSDSSTGAGEMQLREDLADAMMESPGLSHRDPGHGMGHVIVQMKPQSSVIKVVNPIGTVITLPSDEEIDCLPVPLDTDSYIHENCDETLFRPIVAAARNVVVSQIKGRLHSQSPSSENNSALIETDNTRRNNAILQSSEQKFIHCTVASSTVVGVGMGAGASAGAKKKFIPDQHKKSIESTSDTDTVESVKLKLSDTVLSESHISCVTSKSEERENFDATKFALKNSSEQKGISKSKNSTDSEKKHSKWVKETRSDPCSDTTNRDESINSHSKLKRLSEKSTVINVWEKGIMQDKERTSNVKRDLIDEDNVNKRIDHPDKSSSKPLSSECASSTTKWEPCNENENKRVHSKKSTVDESKTEKNKDTSIKSKKQSELSFEPTKKLQIDKKDVELLQSSVSDKLLELQTEPKIDTDSIKEKFSSEPMSYAKISKRSKIPASSEKNFESEKKRVAIEVDNDCPESKQPIEWPDLCVDDVIDVSSSGDIYTEEEEHQQQVIKGYDYKMDSDENYVEAENCGLRIGESCLTTDLIASETIPKIKSKKNKNKKIKIREDALLGELTSTKTEANDVQDMERSLTEPKDREMLKDEFMEDIELEDQFLSLEPDVQEATVSSNTNTLLLDNFDGEQMLEECDEVTQVGQNESDDSIKNVKSDDIDSGDSELLALPVEETSLAGQLKASKKKSKKKRR